MPTRESTETLAAPLAHDDSDELRRITAPTPLLWGGTDGVVGRDIQDTLTERFRGAQSLSYP